jgi:hypothetical protein
MRVATKFGVGLAAATVLTVGGTGAAIPRVGDSQASPLAPAAIVTGQVQLNSEGPIRIFDSRFQRLGNGDHDPAGSGAFVTLVGSNGSGQIVNYIPANATAVFVNITVVVHESRYGWLAAAGRPWQGNSTLNWSTAGQYANAALVPVTANPNDPNGSKTLEMFIVDRDNIDVIIDLAGWVVS